MLRFHQFALTLVVTLIEYGYSADNNVLVNIPQGSLQGFNVNLGTNKSNLYYGEASIFLGIPFVEPPVGQRRFQKPTPLCTFPGNSPYNATYFRPICPQGGASNESMSEDCLYLNVFTPNVKQTKPLPVMLWIHGGSMMHGSAKEFGYKGAVRNFVSRGIVVVTIQYRLGLLGFFTSYTDDFPPNLGMLDQVEAIRWVSNNIAYFGGDPQQITLFGQSAGSASVSAHTYSPLSQNLFQKAILESGVATTCFEGSLGFTHMSFRRANAICNTTQQQWSANNFNSTKNCLMNADYHTFLPYDSSFQDVMGWKMSQDNYFMPGIPSELASKRPNIPILIGSMQNEWSLFDLSFLASGVPLPYYTKAGFQEEFQVFGGFVGKEENNVMNIIENVYTPPGTAADDHIGWLKINDKALTCAGFTGFIGQEIDNYLMNSNPQVYLYQMTYAPNVGKPSYTVPGWNPVPHAAEVPYVWVEERKWNAAIQAGSVTAQDYQLLYWFADTWSNFAKSGTPTSDWPALSTRGVLNYYELNMVANTMKPNYRLIDQTVWNQVVPVLAGPLPPNRPNYNNGSSFERIREEYRQFAADTCVVTFNTTTRIPTSSRVQTTVQTTTIGTTTATASSITQQNLETFLLVLLICCFV